MGARMLLKESFEAIDKAWPAVKYCSLGLYSAWILLVMGGNGFVSVPEALRTGQANNLLYLSSGVPLTVTLVLCGLLHKRIEEAISHGPLVQAMGLLASVCTFVLAGGIGALSPSQFMLASAGTGIGNAFVCLRIGHMYSTLTSNNVFFSTFASGLVANIVYFMCVSIDVHWGAIVLSSLPFLATVLALLRPVMSAGRSDDDMVPIDMLPRGFFARSTLMVLVFSLAVGIIKGLATLELPSDLMAAQANNVVFYSFTIAIVLIGIFAITLGAKRFDLSKLYYPITVIACMGILLSPLLGESFRVAQVIIVNTSYNIFILIIWCIYSNIAGQTTLSPVYVFGFGRGASAGGTTAGQFVAFLMASSAPFLAEHIDAIAVGLVLVILVSLLFVMGETTISDALEKTFREEAEQIPMDSGVAAADPEKLWDDRCALLAQRFSLTSREAEVLVLLGRGRTASYIADELGIAYNTTKGHVRNLYAKCGVHSRQELIDLIDAAQ